MNIIPTILVSLLVTISSIFGASYVMEPAPMPQKDLTPEMADLIEKYVAESLKDAAILGATLPIAGTTYNLSGAGVSSSATSIVLQSFTIPQTGQKIVDADMSDVFFLTLEPGNRSKQEIVSCTTVVQNASTATLSGCIRGLSPIYPYTASSTLQFVHAGGSQVIFSDPPQFFNRYAARDNNEFISGAWTASSTNPWKYDNSFTVASSSQQMVPASWIFNNFIRSTAITTANGTTTYSATGGVVLTNSPSNPTDAANKGYVDGVAVAGASNADTVTKGIVEEATVDEVNALSSTGGTGAKLFITPATFGVSNLASSTIAGNILSVLASTATGGDLYRTGIAVTANDVLIITANLYNAATCNGGAAVSLILNLKQSTYAASSTIGNAENNDGGTNTGCSVALTRTFTATTTETINVQVDDVNGGTDETALTILQIKF